MSTNDITGDQIKTKAPSDSYRDGWDRIFKKKVDDKKEDKKDTSTKTKTPNKPK